MNFELSKYLITLSLIVGLVSCSENDRIDPVVGDVTVELNVPSANSLSMVTRGMTDDAKIDNIHVLEYNGTNLVRITPRTITGSSFTHSITSGVNKLVVLANVDASTLTAAGVTVGSSYSALHDVKVSLANATTGWDATTPKSIPMWGEGGVSGSSVSIELLRMLARINVEVSVLPAEFELTSVHLYNTNQRGFLVPTLDGSNNVELTDDAIATKSNNIIYTAVDAVTGNMVNEIYTFETAKGAGVVGDPCLVLGGKYNGGAVTYYRVNFHTGSVHLDVKRNHSYNFDITNVSNPGYGTPDDAYNAKPIDIVYDVIPWDDSDFKDFVIDGQYYLTVNKSVWELPEAGVSVNNESYKIIVKTDYTGDLVVTNSDDSWLTFNNTGDSKNIYIKATDNTGGNLRTGTITIKAGRLSKVIYITQIGVATFTSHSAWAGSNIYWNGTTLTFDDTPADPANPTSADEANWRKQGVYFQWGSLWGLDPSGPASWSGVVYVPSGSGYTQTTVLASDYVSGMPRVSDSENLGDNRTRAYLYEITNGSTGIGDICKYLTEIGSAPGGKKWRMPTSIEFGPGWEEYRLVAFNNAANDGNRYHYYTEPATSTYYTSDKSGRAPILEGTYKVETANDPTSARTFFPASGGRWNVSSGLDRAGDYGLYLSSSAKDALGRGMGFSVIGGGNGRMSPDNGNIRQYCFPVRCVAE